MIKTDTRILELIKAVNLPATKTAETTAQKAMDAVFEIAPKAGVENFYFWLLMNYYTYEIVQDLTAKIEENK